MTSKPVIAHTDAPMPTSPNSLSVEREALYEKFKPKIAVNTSLDRTLVSYQANKKVPFYGWFKYKEGFSEGLVDYILQRFQPATLLDPFSGAGTALFAGSKRGWRTTGIELLPVGIYATKARLAAQKVNLHLFKTAMTALLQICFTDWYHEKYALRHIAITNGAFPEQEERELVGYISYCSQMIHDPDIQMLLLFAAFCILEEISYTRKDGQYLRWDTRSGRSQGEVPFHKGYIPSFREAITAKLKQMAADLEGSPPQPTLFAELDTPPLDLEISEPEVYQGSCLEMLAGMPSNSVDVVLTSPPYANRYDYTRTYALELVYLGCNEDQVKYLRQEMLSCTVESKSKEERLETFYKALGRDVEIDTITAAFHKQGALQEIFAILDTYIAEKKLNNAGIASLVRNYFYEMSFVLYELARILKPGGTIVMVNDNVRYAGEEVPVDLILSNLAELFGLTIKNIWTLSRGKGNSSQQMGNHGRSELRKCIYIWEKEIHMAGTRDQLLIEAHQINYRLRSTFFYRKLKEYNVLTFPSIIAHLTPHADLYNWDQRSHWGISEDAFTYISTHKELKLIQVFCHPKLLREYPTLLAYYRNIAALSQKAVGYLSNINVSKYETDQEHKTALNDQQITVLTQLFNEHMSLIIDSSIQSFTEQELQGLLLTSTGAQIDGAWRNAIGEEAERVVQRLLIKESVKIGLLSAFIPRSGMGMETFIPAQLEEQLGNIGRYRGILLNNQTSILFSSEPDISLIGKDGTTVGVIEVKGGTDPAGALERYGAAKKSFEDTHRTSPRAKTLLVASCITPEALQRINQDKTIFRYFNLTQLVKEKQKYNEFVEVVFTLLNQDFDAFE